MAVQRVTISLPIDVYKDLQKNVSAGEISEFVAKSLRSSFMMLRLRKKESVTDRILRLRESGPKYTTEEIQDFIDKGRP